jgi:ADP-dependent NAD(P)H-hydrate dehydratase / NAD(P)H-hydrate epimerase
MQTLLTNRQMSLADALAVQTGISGARLMEAAGASVAAEIMTCWGSETRVLVLCGPGNNGGDGYVIARLLTEAWYPVQLASLGDVAKLQGDAAHMVSLWQGNVMPVATILPENILLDVDLIVDCLFGAGLTRDLDGEIAELVLAANKSGLPIVAVDLPSGVHGDTGQVRGVAMNANLTVTFFRKKPGHLLMPGRDHCGETIVADIGIPASVLEQIAPQIAENAPTAWWPGLSAPRSFHHKYDRGHAIVVSGGMTSTGAARLGARAALRIGAGVVSIASPPSALAVNAAHLTAIMLRRLNEETPLSKILDDRRINAVLVGPGNGVNQSTRANTLGALETGAAVVLDADALTSFEDDPKALFEAIAASGDRSVVLTPHDGEFRRLFKEMEQDSESSSEAIGGKIGMVLAAAKRSGAIVILKGADTVIAAPDGRAAINGNAPPWLATAGSGDVLAGFATGLLAQGLPAFEAACAACWIHGEAGNLCGRGLIAEDLAEMIPRIFAALDNKQQA